MMIDNSFLHSSQDSTISISIDSVSHTIMHQYFNQIIISHNTPQHVPLNTRFFNPTSQQIRAINAKQTGYHTYHDVLSDTNYINELVDDIYEEMEQADSVRTIQIFTSFMTPDGCALPTRIINELQGNYHCVSFGIIDEYDPDIAYGTVLGLAEFSSSFHQNYMFCHQNTISQASRESPEKTIGKCIYGITAFSQCRNSKFRFMEDLGLSLGCDRTKPNFIGVTAYFHEGFQTNFAPSYMKLLSFSNYISPGQRMYTDDTHVTVLSTGYCRTDPGFFRVKKRLNFSCDIDFVSVVDRIEEKTDLIALSQGKNELKFIRDVAKDAQQRILQKKYITERNEEDVMEAIYRLQTFGEDIPQNRAE